MDTGWGEGIYQLHPPSLLWSPFKTRVSHGAGSKDAQVNSSTSPAICTFHTLNRRGGSRGGGPETLFHNCALHAHRARIAQQAYLTPHLAQESNLRTS